MSGTKQILTPDTTKPLLPIPLVRQVLSVLLSEARLGPQSRKPLTPEKHWLGFNFHHGTNSTFFPVVYVHTDSEGSRVGGYTESLICDPVWLKCRN